MQTELGWALWQLGERRAGVAVLDDVLARDGQNPDALRARGEMLADLDDARDAIRDLDRVTWHGQPSARAARGLALARLGQHQAADQEIDAALADAPRNGPVLLYTARAEALGGDRIAAVNWPSGRWTRPILSCRGISARWRRSWSARARARARQPCPWPRSRPRPGRRRRLLQAG